MNLINTPEQNDATISEMRGLMAQIDSEVFAAYHWTDLQAQYDFQPFSGGSTNDPWRWALNDQVLSEIIRRLTDLNKSQYEAEVAAGLHGNKAKSGKPTKKTSRAKGAPQPTLDFDTNSRSTIEGGD